jgi:glycosyltransferase involved in cell wall biosynthesis
VVKLSLCLITKDEERNISACLDSVKGVADEIILVDTSSKDDTVNIAAGYGAKIYTFLWCNDFAAARNEALKHASGDFILALDADEWLDIPSRKKIRQLLNNPAYQAYLLQQKSPYKINDSNQRIYTVLSFRLFQNHMGFHYKGRVHEHIDIDTAGKETKIALTNITFNHEGYKGNLELKNRRNYLLRQSEKPAKDGFHAYDMARVSFGMGKFAIAIRQIEHGLKINSTAAWLRAQMYVLLGDILLHTDKDPSKPLKAWHEALKIDNIIVGPYLRLGRIYYLRGDYEAALKQLERVITLLSLGSMRGAITDDECTLPEAFNSIAACYLKMGRRDNAADALVKSRTAIKEDETLKTVPWNVLNVLR